MRFRPIAASVAAWSVGAATAVGVGMLALSLIGSGLTDGPIQPLAANDPTTPSTSVAVPTRSSAGTAPAPRTSETGKPGTGEPGTGTQRTVTSLGGTVITRCADSGAYLVGWSPTPGFGVDDVVRGPGSLVKVTFTNRDQEIKITVSCANGVPQAKTESENRGSESHE